MCVRAAQLCCKVTSPYWLESERHVVLPSCVGVRCKCKKGVNQRRARALSHRSGSAAQLRPQPELQGHTRARIRTGVSARAAAAPCPTSRQGQGMRARTAMCKRGLVASLRTHDRHWERRGAPLQPRASRSMTLTALCATLARYTTPGLPLLGHRAAGRRPSVSAYTLPVPSLLPGAPRLGAARSTAAPLRGGPAYAARRKPPKSCTAARGPRPAASSGNRELGGYACPPRVANQERARGVCSLTRSSHGARGASCRAVKRTTWSCSRRDRQVAVSGPQWLAPCAAGVHSGQCCSRARPRPARWRQGRLELWFGAGAR